MEDESRNTLPEDNNVQEEEQEAGQEETQERGMPTRTCIMMILAGLYLLYTGYKLCSDVLNGVEGGSWGFAVAGVGFFIVGAGMLVISGKNFLKKQKEKQEAESAEQKSDSPVPEEPRKTMSIAERARLASTLAEEENNTSDENTLEDTEEEAKGPAENTEE